MTGTNMAAIVRHSGSGRVLWSLMDFMNGKNWDRRKSNLI